LLKRADRTIALVALTTASAVSPGARAQDLETPGASEFALIGQTINPPGIAMSVLLLFSAWALLRFVDALIEDMGKSHAGRRLLLQRLNAFFHFFVYICVISAVILLSFKISEQVLAVLGGALFISIGFATRDLLASLVAGVMIIFDRPFQVGDRVRFGGEYGDILNIGLRSVKLRTLDDSIVTIPNNLFLSEVAASGNAGALDMQIMVDFYIGIDQDADKAMALVREAAAGSRYIYLAKPIVVLVKQLVLDNCVGLQVRLKAYVLDTHYEKAFETDVTLRVQESFREHSILPPAVLHRDLNTAPNAAAHTDEPRLEASP
jgi:small-conductance mechanosensitive channel